VLRSMLTMQRSGLYWQYCGYYRSPIFIPDTTAGGVGRMLGFVVKADAGVSANNVIFGNANKGYVFQHQRADESGN